MTRFLCWLTARLRCRIINGPNGEPYLERYYLFRLFGFTAYIHRFVDNDPDRGLHDHPWSWSCALVLAGGYHELRATGMNPHRTPDIILRYLKPGRFNVIRGDDFHRIILHWNQRNPGVEAWTLFVHRARTKGWGFVEPSIRLDLRQRRPVLQWPPGAVPLYKPFALTRAGEFEGWEKTAPRGREFKTRAPRRAA